MDVGIDIENDHSDEVIRELERKVSLILESWGMTGEKYAKLASPVDTGNLRRSITYEPDDSEDAVYIGTNVEYAPYQELGTSKHPAANDGRGFLRPAVFDHLKEYQQIAESILKE